MLSTGVVKRTFVGGNLHLPTFAYGDGSRIIPWKRIRASREDGLKYFSDDHRPQNCLSDPVNAITSSLFAIPDRGENRDHALTMT